VGLDKDTNKELLFKHIQGSGDAGTQFKELQQAWITPITTSKRMVSRTMIKMRTRLEFGTV
jgi:hypothetical protein